MGKPRNVSIKGRCVYWTPNATLRRLGYHGQTLGKDFTVAFREAEKLNAEADAYRLSVERGKFAPIPGTLTHLIGVYRAHEDFTDLADSTRRTYNSRLEAIGADMGDAKLTSITHPVVQSYKRSLRAKPFEANHRLRTLRLLFSFAIREGYFKGANPAQGFRQLKTSPRNVVWSLEDERRFLDAAPPELHLPYLTAIYTAQRQGDLLSLPWSVYDGKNIEFRQSKTGQRLIIPVFDRLRAALDSTARQSPTMLVDRRGRPWQADWFQHWFARWVKRAGLENRRFQDLRRTAIVRLAEAGAEVQEIRSISGHSIDYCSKILEVYLPRTRALAQRAVRRMR